MMNPNIFNTIARNYSEYFYVSTSSIWIDLIIDSLKK